MKRIGIAIQRDGLRNDAVLANEFLRFLRGSARFHRVFGSGDEGTQHDHHNDDRDTNNQHDDNNIYNTRRGAIYQ